MKEVINTLESEITKYIVDLSEDIHQFNKKYIIPGAILFGFFGISSHYFISPLIKETLPKIDKIFNQGNPLYYGGKLYSSKKEIEEIKKQEFLFMEEEREKNRLKELKEAFLLQLKNLDNTKDPKAKMELTEQLMDNYEIMRENK